MRRQFNAMLKSKGSEQRIEAQSAARTRRGNDLVPSRGLNEDELIEEDELLSYTRGSDIEVDMFAAECSCSQSP